MDEIAALHNQFVEKRHLSLHIGLQAEEVQISKSTECNFACFEGSAELPAHFRSSKAWMCEKLALCALQVCAVLAHEMANGMGAGSLASL